MTRLMMNVVAVASPSFGPAVITVAGLDVPVLAFVTSMFGLLLARSIAPSSRRSLSRRQELALTVLLILVLFMIVTGQFGGKMLSAGMALVWGIGLGTSGLLVIEFFGNWVMDMMRKILYGLTNAPPTKDDQ